MRDPLLTYLTSRQGSPLGELAEAALARDGELEDQRDRGTLHPLMQRADELEKAAEAVDRDLDAYSARADVRKQIASYLESVVLPGTWETRLRRLPDKLRSARQKCWSQMDGLSGDTRVIWDEKAGEPLLCPDDSREEGMRLQRRLEGRVEELARQGYRVYYGVLTIENALQGHCATRVEKLWRKFKRALKAEAPNRPRKVPKKSWPRLFPIVGAIATLECPLSASRTWHPHLNVILVTRGFFDWSSWWQHWGCVSHFQALKPGNVAAAFRELIKYAVRAVPEKSAAKAGSNTTCLLESSSPSLPSPSLPASPTCSDTATDTAAASSAGSRSAGALRNSRKSSMPSGPAMIEWTRAEWLEWWSVMKGRRRTRTYGELYGLNVDPEEVERIWLTIGTARWNGFVYEHRVVLLECIPGDKSIRNVKERYRRWLEEHDHPPEEWRRIHAQLREAARLIEFEEMQP